VNGAPERIHTMQVTPSFFRLVRVPPRTGRRFSDEEGVLGGNRAVILSEGLWQRLYGGRDGLGQTLRIDGEAHTVVGVMPAAFVFIDSRVQAWVPLAFTDRQKAQHYSNNRAYLGRLKPDATLQQAQLDALTAANFERFPETTAVLRTTGYHVVAARLQADLVRDVRATLYLLWGGALFVLLIGAGLLLASFRRVLAYLVTERTKEIGIRIAFGGTRSGIVQLVLREGLLLIAAGIVFGVAGAAALGRSLERQLFGVRTTDPIALSLAVAALGLVALAACALPARRATRINPVVVLAE